MDFNSYQFMQIKQFHVDNIVLRQGYKAVIQFYELEEMYQKRCDSFNFECLATLIGDLQKKEVFIHGMTSDRILEFLFKQSGRQDHVTR